MSNALQNPSPPPQELRRDIEDSKGRRITSEEEFYDAEEEGEVFTCEICIEPTKNSALTNAAIVGCTHQYCVDCTAKYIRVKIEDYNVAHIDCPAPNCTRTLDPLACAPIVGKAVFVRWCDALCRSVLPEIDGGGACYCPYPDCSELLLLSDCASKKGNNSAAANNKTRNDNKVKCPMCKRLLCLACKKVWHAGFGCNDVATDRDDVAFGRLAEKMAWKRCPGCRHFVERSGGCRVVKCRCGIRLCYKCGRKIQGSWCNCDRSCICCSWFYWLCWVFFIVFVLPWLSLIIIKHMYKHH